MEKDQLISMIHFLVKREDERAQENQELKEMDTFQKCFLMCECFGKSRKVSVFLIDFSSVFFTAPY